MTKPEPSWVHVHNKDEMEAFYRGVLPNIITEAKYHGYAIGLHGSLRRDLDLIAVPWTDDHSDKDELARAVQEAACGMPSAKYQWEKKPCGRWAASFPICWTEMTNELSLGHIDLSVMASAPPEALCSGWEPMDTAPKDGTEFLAWRKDAGVMLVRWTAPVDFLSERELDTIEEDAAHAEGWFYADFVRGDRLEGDMIPTLWMPTPSVPSPQRFFTATDVEKQYQDGIERLAREPQSHEGAK